MLLVIIGMILLLTLFTGFNMVVFVLGCLFVVVGVFMINDDFSDSGCD